MALSDPRAPVIAGVTRASSGQSVLWAADEAARRARPLELVHAQDWPAGTEPGISPEHSSDPWGRTFRAAGEAVLDSARLAAAERHPRLETSTTLAEGRPVRVLREAADRAALLVVGGRRPQHPEDALRIGGIGTSLAGHTPCPVAVVLGPDPEPATDGPVVVGVDGSEHSAAAVAFAFQDAALRHTDLLAVEVRAPRDVGTPDFEEESLLALSKTLAGWQERHPDVPVRQEVRTGHPAAELALAAAHAQCLVVGSRGRGGFRGLLLGSTSRTLTHLATCPLVVLPHSTTTAR